MKMNYSEWFYRQHRYLIGDDKTYNDTKWVNINDRYQALIDRMSPLLKNQPYGVVGNLKGFDYLADLMNRSNYTFEDVNQALIDTYNVSLTNAMSRMLVNTQAVMFHCTQDNTRYVSKDKLSDCFIIDAPFNQMHFGERDEFIRQRIQKIHNMSNGYYIPINDFIQSEFTKILGFTILCSVNGKIFNDCQVAVDDKGFKFKIKWRYASDIDVIIYKFDECAINEYTVPVSKLRNHFISYEDLGMEFDFSRIGTRCLLNIYDKNTYTTYMSVPNFGMYSARGLELQNIQEYTMNMLVNNNINTATLVVYHIKYLAEVPNIYPACNYYDLIDTRAVYTEDGDPVKDVNHKRILSSASATLNTLDTCTPPIVLDHSVDTSFQTICDCLSIADTMHTYTTIITDVGKTLQTLNPSDSVAFRFEVSEKLKKIYPGILDCYNKYTQGAILTSMIPDKLVRKFKTFLDNVNGMIQSSSENFTEWVIDEYYGNNYISFVNEITAPFTNTKLAMFQDLQKLSENYFASDNHMRFKRPVAEQCFITLRYHREDSVWLFDYPTIKHFKGIQNAFYIDSDLDGSELFKFFVLYSDTESPSERSVTSLTMDQICDYDVFCDEIEKHIGYIRYWYAENKVMKLSKMLYQTYTDDTIAHVLSKILQHKIEGTDILDVYPSAINYEPSNVTSDNVGGSDTDDRNPFAINFLFYTLNSLFQNHDQLQTYFMNKLTDSKYHARYVDVDVSSMMQNQKTYPVNYSRFCLAPNNLNISESNIPDTTTIFYGLPIIKHASNVMDSNMYRYTFNVYTEDIKHCVITDNDVSEEFYGKSDLSTCVEYVYENDIQIVQMITQYLCHVYQYIDELTTDYQKPFNRISICNSAIETITKDVEYLKLFHDTHTDAMHDQTETIVMSIIQNNPFIQILQECITRTNAINTIKHHGRSISIYSFFNTLLTTVKRTYTQTGFDNQILKRVKKFYNHLKKINTTLNLYAYQQWLNQFDSDLLNILDSLIAKNEEVPVSSELFSVYGQSFSVYHATVNALIGALNTSVQKLNASFKTSHIQPITEYCNDIIQHFIFDLYTIDRIAYDRTKTFSDKPGFITITLARDSHTNIPIENPTTGETKLIFQPIYEKIGQTEQYVIKSISNVCEYTFFDDIEISCVMNIYNPAGTQIGTIPDAKMSFHKVSSTSDQNHTFQQLVNARTTHFDFENDFENFDGKNASSRVYMNYEMLIGNHFKPLGYEHEYVLQNSQQSPIDRVYLENQEINTLLSKYHFGNTKHAMYFKPVQVFHPNQDQSNVITSIGGKYFIGQTLYLSTKEGYIFPVIVTTIDHSENRGFVEAHVDCNNAKWYNTDNPDTIESYLTSDIECSVIDDNIRNFLDEFNNQSYEYFSNIDMNIEPSESDCYKLPGDPIYVSNHSDYVYTRLQWFFPDAIENRFIDDEHKTSHFVYVDKVQLYPENDSVQIQMFNHRFNPLSNPEMYPVLREEPNDHEIWKKEREVFNTKYRESEQTLIGYERQLQLYREQYKLAESESERDRILLLIEKTQYDIKSEIEFRDKMKTLVQQLEPPTKWYNVRAYDDTLVYIDNGRASRSYSFREYISDMVYSDKLEVFVYDWEHKQWLNPSLFEITKTYEDGLVMDNPYYAKTNHVLTSITIKRKDDTVTSKQLLVYFAYTKSDIFNDIEMHPYTCKVRFKPVLSIGGNQGNLAPYSDIRIRKHFDGKESYKFIAYNTPENFSKDKAYYVRRVNHNSKYVYAPVYRFKDLKFEDANQVTYDYTNFDLYVKNPFQDTNQPLEYKTQVFDSVVKQPISNFVPNTKVKLICVEQNHFDGSISDIMFEGVLSYTGDSNDIQHVVISTSTLKHVDSGDYICSVFRDDMYSSYGGLISVHVETSSEIISDDNFAWIHITNDCMNRELPYEFLITPKDDTVPEIGTIHLQTKYNKTTANNVTQTSYDTYYYDSEHDVRLPFSDITHEDPTNRMILDLTQNTDVKPIQSTYYHVCRYSRKHIPKNGVIDLTGYVPTPLSRDRYEFWVNGRFIKDPKNLTILSPTSIQLTNLTSLRNFEVLELVDDLDNSTDIIHQGSVYIDLNGKTYNTFASAIQSNQLISQQKIQFVFNTDVHTGLQDYTRNIIQNPNNTDIDEDIMTYIKESIDTVSSYNQLINVPTINGVSIYHPRTSSLGIMEIPNYKILELFDQVWKYEHITNPLFEHTQRDGYDMIQNKHIEIRIKKHDEYDIVYLSGISSQYFTLYISTGAEDTIDDTTNTVKIIPFIQAGTHVVIDKKYRGDWIHTTDPECKPIRL